MRLKIFVKFKSIALRVIDRKLKKYMILAVKVLGIIFKKKSTILAVEVLQKIF